MSICLPVIGAPDKPLFGAPCNGCGACCAMETCALARELMGAMEAPCPAMEFEDGRFWCGLVRNPDKHLGVGKLAGDALRPALSLLLGIGQSCDSEFLGDK